MARILTVDDDESILSTVRRILTADGHTVTAVSQAEKLDGLELDSFDLILLDVMMPDKDGYTLCSEIRDRVDCPILFLTAKTAENDLVSGLSVGGDDYICKPFGKLELRARVSAHLRREKREHTSRLSFDGGYFNLSSMQLFVGETPVSLTKGEYLICEFLARNAPQVFSREQIIEGVFGLDSDSSDNTISTHIKNIRAKLDAMGWEPIKTVWGIGYKWEG